MLDFKGWCNFIDEGVRVWVRLPVRGARSYGVWRSRDNSHTSRRLSVSQSSRIDVYRRP